MIKSLSTFFCSGFGVGFIPLMPGTIASIVILPLIWFVKTQFSLQILILGIFIYFLISLFLLKIILVNKKNMDPSYVVCDEYIGQSIALLFCEEKISEYVISFILFRILDIKKPFPIIFFDKLKNPTGVLMDDVIAGIIVAFGFFIYYGI